MNIPEPGIEILEKEPELHGAKVSLLRFALLNEIRALVNELDARVDSKGRGREFKLGRGWPDSGREEIARVEIGLLLQMLPRLGEGPF